MKLKIVSDGTPMGTRVEDEKGNRIEGIIAVAWGITVDGIAECRLHFHPAKLEYEGLVEETTQLGDGYRSFKMIESKPGSHEYQG